jgi:hypothetical protein
MILGDHRQEKKRNKKTRLARLDWDINTGYRWRNSLAGRIGSSTRPTTTHNADTGDKKQPQLPPAGPHVSDRRSNPPLIRSRGAGTTAPKRATAVQDLTLQCCCTHADHLTAWRTPSLKQNQHAGASPHPPLDTLSRARGPPPTRRTTPRSGHVPRIAAKVARRGALSPGKPNQAARSPLRFELSRRNSPAPSRRHQARKTKEVARAVFRRWTAPRELSHAVNPAAIRCGPSPHRLPLPQAPSFNDVPHRAGECQATPGAAKRCKRPNSNQVRTLVHQQKSTRLGEG